MASQSKSTEDRSGILIGVVSMCLFIGTLVTTLRLWTRHFILKRFGIDDYFCFVAWLVTFGCGVSICIQTIFGLGKHVWNLEDGMLTKYREAFYYSVVLYNTALLFIKMTLILQYYRILGIQEMKKVYLAAIAIIGAWSTSQVLIAVFTCWPIPGFWDDTVKARCISTHPSWYINAAGNILTDIVVFLLPIPAVRKLKLPNRQKYILLAIFCLGFFTVTISVIRIHYLKQYEDVTWKQIPSSLWSFGELTSALACTCLPTIRPFFIRYFPAIAEKFGRSTGNYAKSHSGKTGENSRNHHVSGAVGRHSIHSQRQLVQNSQSAFELQDQNISDRMGSSKNESDEDLVSPWSMTHVDIRHDSAIAVREPPCQGIRVQTDVHQTTIINEQSK